MDSRNFELMFGSTEVKLWGLERPFECPQSVLSNFECLVAQAAVAAVAWQSRILQMSREIKNLSFFIISFGISVKVSRTQCYISRFPEYLPGLVRTVQGR